VENPVTIRQARSEWYPWADIPMIQPITPNIDDQTNTGRFPNLVAKAETKGLL
jgi:hypothetical protein